MRGLELQLGIDFPAHEHDQHRDIQPCQHHDHRAQRSVGTGVTPGKCHIDRKRQRPEDPEYGDDRGTDHHPTPLRRPSARRVAIQAGDAGHQEQSGRAQPNTTAQGHEPIGKPQPRQHQRHTGRQQRHCNQPNDHRQRQRQRHRDLDHKATRLAFGIDHIERDHHRVRALARTPERQPKREQCGKTQRRLRAGRDLTHLAGDRIDDVCGHQPRKLLHLTDHRLRILKQPVQRNKRRNARKDRQQAVERHACGNDRQIIVTECAKHPHTDIAPARQRNRNRMACLPTPPVRPAQTVAARSRLGILSVNHYLPRQSDMSVEYTKTVAYGMIAGLRPASAHGHTASMTAAPASG